MPDVMFLTFSLFDEIFKVLSTKFIQFLWLTPQHLSCQTLQKVLEASWDS